MMLPYLIWLIANVLLFLADCMPILSENLMPEFHSDDDELPSVSDKAFSVLVKIAVKLGKALCPLHSLGLKLLAYSFVFL